MKKLTKINFKRWFLLTKAKKKEKRYEESLSKIRDLISLITKNSDDFDEKYMKIKFNSDDKLPLSKAIKLPRMIIVAQTIFPKNSKYYPQHFCDECLYK